jgi:hypothetical protein
VVGAVVEVVGSGSVDVGSGVVGWGASAGGGEVVGAVVGAGSSVGSSVVEETAVVEVVVESPTAAPNRVTSVIGSVVGPPISVVVVLSLATSWPPSSSPPRKGRLMTPRVWAAVARNTSTVAPTRSLVPDGRSMLRAASIGEGR